MKEKVRKAYKEKLDFKKLLSILAIVFIIILIFTFIDYLIHSLSKEYSVPSYYFKNKIIFGTGIGFAAYLFLRKKKLIAKSFVFSLAISFLLQIRYFLEGFSLKFVLEFLLIHFVILFALSLIFFRLFSKEV